MRLREWRFSALALGLLALGACALARMAPAAAPDSSAEAVQAVSGKALKEALAKHKGKAVLLNLWATWCPPCVEEFPALVKLHEKYRDQGLMIIAASVDEPQDRDEVVAFIRGQKAAFPVYIRSGGSIDGFVGAIDKGWGGSVPTTYLYDRTGKRHGKAIVGSRSLAQFEAVVKPLLK
ncbi:MAG: TlpA disulfide reductase family protein [Armatimonadota bacterium]